MCSKEWTLRATPLVPANCDLVVETRRGTTLEKGGIRIHTTEHLLAALYGCGIDNALIEMTGPKSPLWMAAAGHS